jgi:hypothetical protein
MCDQYIFYNTQFENIILGPAHKLEMTRSTLSWGADPEDPAAALAVARILQLHSKPHCVT